MTRAIPRFTCKAGCSRCCGVTPFSNAERARASELRPLEQWTRWTDESSCLTGAIATGRCPMLTRDGCGIYADRPMICQLFGSVDNWAMTCPEGCGPKQRKLSNSEAEEHLKAADLLPRELHGIKGFPW